MRKTHARRVVLALAAGATIAPVAAVTVSEIPAGPAHTHLAHPDLVTDAHQTPAQRAASLRNLARARAVKAAQPRHLAKPAPTKATPRKATAVKPAGCRAGTVRAEDGSCVPTSFYATPAPTAAQAKATAKAEKAAAKAAAAAVKAAAKAATAAAKAAAKQAAAEQKAAAKAADYTATHPYGPVGTSEVTNRAHHGETYVPGPDPAAYAQQLAAELAGTPVACPNGAAGRRLASGAVVGCF